MQRRWSEPERRRASGDPGASWAALYSAMEKQYGPCSSTAARYTTLTPRGASRPARFCPLQPRFLAAGLRGRLALACGRPVGAHQDSGNAIKRARLRDRDADSHRETASNATNVHFCARSSTTRARIRRSVPIRRGNHAAAAADAERASDAARWIPSPSTMIHCRVSKHTDRLCRDRENLLASSSPGSPACRAVRDRRYLRRCSVVFYQR
jgi:hypothetical protein